jgi:hypothetical protein
MQNRRLEWVDQHVFPFADLAGRVLITALLVWLTVGLLVAVKRAAPTGSISYPTSVKLLIVAATMAFFSSFIWLFSFNTLGSTLRAELYGSAIGDDVQTHQSPRLAHLASLLAGRRATVWCWSRDDWAERAPEIERNANLVHLRGVRDLGPACSRYQSVTQGLRGTESIAQSERLGQRHEVIGAARALCGHVCA